MGKAWHWYWGRRWRRWGTALFGLFLVGSVVSVEVTSQPPFCSSCHIMEPYYASWKLGSHADVSCVKCHIEPGPTSFIKAKLNGLGQVVDDTLNRTSFKPSASVSALSCTRSGCHSVAALEGKIINNGRFKFRHDKHIGRQHLGVAISCGTCHSHVRGDTHFEVNTSVCVNCHLVERLPAGTHSSVTQISFAVRAGYPPGDPALELGDEKRPPSACITCHDAPTEVIDYNGLQVDHNEFLSHGAACESCHASTTQVPQPIEDGRCLQCHTFGVDESLSAPEMHRIHALGEHKIECFNCHGMIRHGPTAETMTLEQFDCQECHINQHSVQQRAYLVETGTGAEEQAINPMFLAHVDCTGCHTEPHVLEANPLSGAEVAAASKHACDRCHKPGLGDQMIPLWQTTTKDLYARAQADLEARRAETLTARGDRLAGEAESLMNLVVVDGSWGVHNPSYTQGLLERALAKLEEAKSETE